MKVESLQADVLCVGGGIAGLMAAIRAAELGAKVVVVEKADTLRSGAGGTGNDHFRCYVPEVHGDIQPIIEEQLQSQIGKIRNISFIRTWMEKSFDIIKLWDSWGIPMRPHGKWEFSGHAFPGRPVTTLKYAGQCQKSVLTREARKRGVQIVNRVMVFDLLRDAGGIVGAIGVGAREDKLVTFQAKSVVLGTGGCVRLYPGVTPGWMFNRSHSPATTGDGRAMALRAGAELVGVEMPYRHSGPKYLARCGKGTWIGVLRDPQGKPIGPFVTRPDKEHGDVISDAYPSVFADYDKSGRGPVYMDCEGITEADYDYMKWGLSHEGNLALLDHLKEEDIDVRKHGVEFTTYELTNRGGIRYNEHSETSVKGLYAAGDEFGSTISQAAVFGWLAGDNATKYIKGVDLPEPDRAKDTVEEKRALLQGMLMRDGGSGWQEANVALSQTMLDYAGTVRSDTMLTAGLSHLRRLRDKAVNTLVAGNQHELVHCLEVLNLFDIGEAVFLASLERKETRGNFIRADYPYSNPLLSSKTLICKRAGEETLVEWR